MTKRILGVLLSVFMLLNCMAGLAGAADLSGSGFKGMLNSMDTFMSGKTPAQRQAIYDLLEVYTSTDSGMNTLIGLVDDQSEVSQLVKDYIDAFGVTPAEKQTLKLMLTLLKCIPADIRRTTAENLHDFVAYAGYDAAGANVKEGTAALHAYLFDGSAAEADGLSEAVFYQVAYNLRDLVKLTADASDPAFNYEFYAFTNETLKNNIETILIPAFPELNGTTIVSAEHLMMLLCDAINADAGLDAAKKRQLAETLATTNSFVYGTSVTALSVSTTGQTTQNTSALTPVTVNLTATKTDAAATGIVPAVEWYVNDSLVACASDSYVFTPSAAGTYTIKAVSGGVTSNVLTVQINAQGGTIIVDPNLPGTGSGSSGVGSGSTGGTGSTSGTVPPATPNQYPSIPDPSKVGFVTTGNTTTAISDQKVTFDDVEEHWSKDYVEVLATAGFLRGHSETNYAPEAGVTREEMAVILVRMLGLEGQAAANPVAFADHANIQGYAVDAIYKLAELGVYKGYSDGTFAPQKVLTREEISALFSRVLGKAGLTTDAAFTDHHEIAPWFEADVENLVNYGVISGYPDASFRPQNSVTRAEAAVMLYNTLYRMGIIK